MASGRTADGAGSGTRNGRNGRVVRALDVCTAIAFGVGDDIAGRRAILASCNAVRIIGSRRNVVDDVDGEGAGGAVAILVGHDNGEVVERRIARGVGGQQIVVTDHAIGDAGDGERAKAAGEGLANGGDGNAIDGDARRTVRCGVGDRAAGEFIVGGSSRTCGQAVLVDLGACFAFGGKVERGGAVGDADGQRRGRGIAVTIGDGVAEHVGDAAGGACVAHIAVRTIGIEREHAILASGRTADGAGSGTRNGRNGRVVRALDVCTAIAFGVGDDIAGRRAILASCNAIRIIGSGRHVVDDANVELIARRISIEIGHHNGEADCAAGSIQRVVVESVGIGNAADAGRRIIGISGDNQGAGCIRNNGLRERARGQGDA